MINSSHQGSGQLLSEELNMDVTQDLQFVRSVVVDNIGDTQIDVSELHGFGLFCQEFGFEAGQELCVLDGQVVTIEHYEKIEALVAPNILAYKNYIFMECNYLGADKLLVRPFRSKYSYINHSRTPNLELKRDPLRVVTLRKIVAGEELTIDYRKEPLPEAYVNNPVKDFL
ncbi:SET domain-containing protein [Shewanella aquimarina]|uniref:SET domain-containing protein n=1 Tax=Shewanella aquimarina TaxID=260365 RepID=UPI002014E891|nr:SET domain-containing protein [Shewanella aquimarina]MCL2909893.1 SET domain-containing protein [Shewanella aquimarina]